MLATHRAQGRKVVFVVDGGDIVAKGGESSACRWPASRSPATAHLASRSRTRWPRWPPAWALGLEWRPSAKGVATLSTTPPPRRAASTCSTTSGATLIADYGHNPDAILALVQAVETMPAKRRSVVISGAGDRRDEDIREQTRILGKVFDDVVLYQDECQRGRADGEVLALLQQGWWMRAHPRHRRDPRRVPGHRHRADKLGPATCA